MFDWLGGISLTGADVAVIGTLILLEGLLSADNALVLAVMVRHLPAPLQRRALLYGLGGAFVFRAIGVLLATFIVRLWYLKLLGAFYLSYLAIRHFIEARGAAQSHGHDVKVKPGMGFWQTVIAVELTDIAFALDSILVAVALTDKIGLILTGGILGIIAMRFAASAFIKLLNIYPGLEHTAYALVGWISVKLWLETIEGFSLAILGREVHLHLPEPIFWGVSAFIVVVGAVVAYRSRDPQGDALGEAAEAVEESEQRLAQR